MPDPRVGDRAYSLYIVRCADDTLYTGIATDLDKRLAEHVAGARGARYLRGRGPIELVFSVEVGDRGTAQRLEHRVKRLSRRRKEALIAGREPLPAVVPLQVLDEACP